MANIHTLQNIDNKDTFGQQTFSTYPPISYGQSTNMVNQGDPRYGYNQSYVPRWYEIFFPRFKWKTFILFITIIDIIIFIITKIYQSYEDLNFTCVLYRFGAKYTPAITLEYEWYRVITPIFLHGGWIHLLFNMLSQLFIGFLLEDYVGTTKLILLYIGSGIAGNLMSCILYPTIISVGASSALFGLFGLELAYIFENYHRLGPGKNMFVLMFIIIIIINFTTISTGSNIDVGAHFGGFVIGSLISIIYVKKPEYPALKFFKIAAIILMIGYYIGMITAIAMETGLEPWMRWINIMCA